MAKLSHKEQMNLAEQLSTPTTKLESLLRSALKVIGDDWSGIMDEMAVLRALAVNPNATPRMLQTLMYYVPEYVGQNSALVLLHLENPGITSYLLEGRNHSHELEMVDFFEGSGMQAINPTIAEYRINEAHEAMLLDGIMLSEFKDGRVLKVHDGFIEIYDSMGEYLEAEAEYLRDNEQETTPAEVAEFFDRFEPGEEP